jgi:glycosyltransferase involved in cell wall biosynthesis
MTFEGLIRSEVAGAVAEPPMISEDIPTLSVLVPVTGRHEDLGALYTRIEQELTSRDMPFEVIFVLDGSRFPQAEKQLRTLRAKCPGVRVYRLNRVFGESTALQAAVGRARGRIVLTLPPYVQFGAGAIGKVLDALHNGYDLVVARRQPRLDSRFNLLQSRIFHLLTRWLTGVRLSDINCRLWVMKADVLRTVPLYGDLHQFLPVLAYKHGFSIAEVPVPQNPGDARLRVYRPGAYLRRFLDIFTLAFLFNFTSKPLRFFGVLGAGVLGTGVLITGYLGVSRLLHATALADRPLLLLGVLLMALGIQTASLGLVGEIIVYTSKKTHDDYIVEAILD